MKTYRSFWIRAFAISASMLVVFATGFSNGVSAEGSAEVVIVGDSITADNVEQIGRLLADAGTATVEFEARSARRIADSYEWNGWRSSGLDAIDSVRSGGGEPALWVIELGTNDMFLVTDRGCTEKVRVSGELIDSVVDALGDDAAIAWVSVLNRDDAEVSRAFNEALRNRAAANPQMVLIDWQHAAVDHPEWFLDLVHPNEVGAAHLAQLYTEAIERHFEAPNDPPPRARSPGARSSGARSAVSGSAVSAGADSRIRRTAYRADSGDLRSRRMPGPHAHHRYSFTAQPADPPTIVRGEGVELITSEGRRIIDAAAGAVVNNIGHGRGEVADAVADALRKLDYVVPIWPTPHRLELADVLVDTWLPDDFEHVYFAGGGSEANDSAVRLARIYHLARGEERRHKVIGRLPSYHGATLATLAIGGHVARRAGLEPLLSEFPKVPWDDADALAGAIEAAGPDTVSAFIAEPVIGASGAALIAPDDYWARVGEICREYGVLVIADEVMTGFGRTGLRWGHQHDGWTPDILVAGKGLGGGYSPLSLLTATNAVVDPITAAGRNVMFFTYSGHDATCAGALAVLDIIEREGLVERAVVQGRALLDGLQRELKEHPNVVEVRGRGLMIGVELTGPTSAAVVAEALDRDVWIYPAGSGPAVNDGLLLAPPMVVEDHHLDRIIEVTRRSIDAAAGR